MNLNEENQLGKSAVRYCHREIKIILNSNKNHEISCCVNELPLNYSPKKINAKIDGCGERE